MRSLIYVDTFLRRLVTSLEGAAWQPQALIAGQDVAYSLRFASRVGDRLVERDFGIRSARVTLGFIDEAPTHGTFRVKFGAAAPSSANRSAALDVNVAQADFRDALNAVDDGPGDVEVSREPWGWKLHRPGGEAMELSVVSNRLRPLSFGRVRGYEVDGAWHYELRLAQAPLAASSLGERVLPDAPSISTVQDGGADASGTYFWNEIQALRLTPEFRGTYQLRRPETFARTRLLDRLDGPEEIQAALNEILAEEGGSVVVTNPTQDVAHIEFVGELAGTDIDELEVHVFSAPPGDWTMELDLGRNEMLQALRSRPSIPNVPLEFDLELVRNPADVEDLEVPASRMRLQTRVEIRRPLAWEGLASVSGVEWLRKPSPQTYTPFHPSQITQGQLSYTELIGDGEATVWPIDHNLDSLVPSGVAVVDQADGRLLSPSEYATVVDSANTVILTFDTAPAADGYLVLVTTPEPREKFLNDFVTTIPQVENLSGILDDLGSRVTALEAVLPSTGPGATGAAPKGLTIVIPEESEVLWRRGEEPLELDERGSPAGLPRRAAYMLPAAHTDSTPALPLDPLPDPATTAGDVWEHTGADRVLIPGAGFVRSAWLEPGGFVASDGRMLYPVDKWPATNSYYPRAFTRDLFAFAINDKMLRVGRTLECVFGVRTQLLHADGKAQWVLVIEKGTAPQEDSPDPVGLNLEDIVWDATPVLTQRIVLSRLLQAHLFGVRIRRLSGGMELDKQLYGVWEGASASAPADANFVLRARLVKFDTENSVPEARGWVFLGLAGGVETGADGSQETKPAQAIIS